VDMKARDKISVGLVQINNSFSGQSYLPYSVGLLQAYAQKHLSRPDDCEFRLPIYARLPLKRAVSELKGCDVVFFSAYTWNMNISIRIARLLKRGGKGPLIVFGGPQVPLRGVAGFLARHKFIDLACHGEGERAFLGILENLRRGTWDGIPNISRLERNGTLVQGRLGERTADLSSIPSPYLAGVFEPLMKANPGENWIALWETNRGCPFSCSYCVWGASSDKKVYARPTEDLYLELDWFSRNRIEFIFCCDANFGILDRDLDLAKRAAENKSLHGYPRALSVQNTKNSTTRIYDIYSTLSAAGLSKGVSLAMQSSNPATLRGIRRANISQRVFRELQSRFNRAGIETFTDFILGLPCETYDTFADGVSEIISSGQHNRVQFNDLSILTGSEMSDPAYLKRYGISSVNSRLVNIHGSLSEAPEVEETQRIVTGTASMPGKDWARCRVFGWTTALLHFDKLLQIPLVLANRLTGTGYRSLVEAFMTAAPDYPVIGNLHRAFLLKARDIQRGGEEYIGSKKWLNIWWPADELALIDLCAGRRLDDFYAEAADLLYGAVPAHARHALKEVLPHALMLNKTLLKRPFLRGRPAIELPYDIWDYYRAVLDGGDPVLRRGSFLYEIDRASESWDSWKDWCRKVVWYGHKRGAYLYPCQKAPGRTGT